MIRSIKNQIRADVRNVQHDIFLLYLIPIPVFLSLIFPFVFEQISLFFGDVLDITPYKTIFTTYIFLTLPAMLWGTVFAFLLINERDLQTLDAIRITPIGLQRLVYFRILSGTFLSILIELMAFYILDYTITTQLLILILLASLFCPFMMFGVSIIAKNKVQALAVMKGLSSFFVLPFFYLLIPQLEILFFVVPPYWVVKPLLNNLTGVTTTPLVYFGGFISQIIWLFFLEKLFHKRLN